MQPLPVVRHCSSDDFKASRNCMNCIKWTRLEDVRTKGVCMLDKNEPRTTQQMCVCDGFVKTPTAE